MKTQTRIGLAVGLILSLFAGLAPRAEAGFEMPITFGGYTNRSEALTNFPVLVVFSNGVGSSGFSFSSHPFVTTNGYDLRFYTNSTDTGDGLDYEIESWNTNAASYVWVRVPLIPTNGMGSIFAKWGDTVASNQLACTTNGAVWTNGFAAVWHMGQTNAQDSTSNRNHGTSFANTNTTGFIGGAQGFNGSSAYIDVGNGTSVRIAGNKLTQSAWINPATNVAYGTILTKRLCYYFQRHNDQKLGAYPYTTSPAAYQYSTGTAPLNVWTHAAIVYDGSLVRFFLNGVESGNAARTGNMGSTSDNLKIGWDTSASARYWNGLLDEVRLCGVARSTNWIWAEYQTMASNTAFSTYSAVSGGDTSSPQVQNRTPTGVATNGATFNGYLLTNGVSDASVYVLWGGTNGTVSSPWAYTNWWAAGAWTNGSYPATNMTLEADREYFYRFGATNSTTNVMASGSQYLITAKLTPATTDGFCGPTYSETATIGISRPASLTNDALVVNYALSGSGTNYVSASPASGFTMAAGEASRNIVFTPVAWNTNAVATVTLTLLPGAYASNDLGSAQVSVTNATTLTAVSDTLIGSAMDVIENPPDTVTATGAGPYTYGFSGLNLNLNGKKIYYNTAQRDVVLTNLASVADSGAGSIDTSWGGATGYIELYSSGPVQIGGSLITKTTSGTAATGLIRVDGTNVRIGGSVLTHTPGNTAGQNSGSVTINAPGGAIGITNYVATFNNSAAGVVCQAGPVVLNAGNITIGGATNGLAIAAYGYGPQTKQGANVTLTAMNGVTLSTGGIDTHGYGGGDVLISDGASGSAGDVYVGGGILSYSDKGGRRSGAITVRGGNIRITGNLNADYMGADVFAGFQPVLVRGSGSVRIDGYVTDGATSSSGIHTGNHDVDLFGGSVTVNGTTNGYSVRSYTACANDTAGNITLTATNGDITVAGGLDADSAKGASDDGYVTNQASGNITIGSLDKNRFKSITLIAGTNANWIYVSGVITNFTTNASPNRINFPAGSVISNNIYYHPVNNGAGLSGEYAIYVGTDTGKKLLVGPPAAGGNPPIVVNGAATNQTDTTAALIGTMASTGTAASVAYVFWSTTDCTNNEAAWLSTGGGVSNLGQRAEGASFTNTISGLSANTRYYYNHMGSNSVGKGWAATNASLSFWTDGPPGVGTNVGATAIGAFSATLNGALTNGVRARIFVFYGTDYNNWAVTNDLGWCWSGTFSTAASGLSMSTPCYYQCRATNIYGSALSAVASFTTVAPTTNTMTGDVPIGDPLAGISAAGTAPYTYDFGAYRTLDMGGYKLYRNDQQRDVRVTNVLAILNGGSVDTSRSGAGLATGYIEIDSSGPVAFTNNLTTRNQADAATGRIVVNATDIRVGGGVMTDDNGWNYSAGSVTLNASSGSIAITNVVATFNHSAGGLANYAGTVTMNAAGSIRVGGAAGGYAIDASGTGGGAHQGGMPVTLTASNGVTLATGGIATYGYGGGNVTVVNSGSGGITIGGSITTLSDEGSRVAGNILLSTASSNIMVTGGYDAYCIAGAASYGTVTNIAGGNITIGTLNAARFKSIALIAGTNANWIYVTGVLTNFTVSESPKKFTFPTGSVVSNDVYYDVVNNGVGLSGTYDIYVGGVDTLKDLKVGPPGAGGNPPIVVNNAATNQTDTTAGLIGTMASTGTAASVAYVFWSTTDCTNNEAAWLSTGGGVSNLGARVEGEKFTNTVSGLGANTRYYYNFMGSNSVGTGWAATNTSPSFWTDGPPGVGTNTGATGVGAFSAILNGSLSNCVSARVFVYYGTDSGNWAYTNDLGWRGTGTFATAASGLPQSTPCYYQCRATNAYGDNSSAVASFTTLAPATNTMTGDVLIGDPLAGINAAGTAPYTYDFGAYRTLDMGGYKLYRNDQQRNVSVTNVLAILNGGSVDTSRGGSLDTGYIEISCAGPVAFTNNLTTRNGGQNPTGRITVNATDVAIGGSVTTDNQGFNGSAGAVAINAPGGAIRITNVVATFNHASGGNANYAGAVALSAGSIRVGGAAGGYAIDASGTEGSLHQGGAAVTLAATNGVTLATGGIAAYGYGGGAVTISGAAAGSAGDIYVGGNILSYNNEGTRSPGLIAITGANIRVTGYLDADQKGSGVGSPAFAPIAIVGSGTVRVDGYVTASRTGDSGIMSGDHGVRIQGASVTVGGTNTSGYSVLAMNACVNDAADNISLIATAGDITVAGGYDAYSAKGSTFGTVTNIATGNITIGSLDASRFKAITLMAGQGGANWIYVTGVLTNFTKTESPKKFTFPAGSVVSNDVYYRAASNTAVGLTGTYDIYAGAANTGMKLRDGEPWARGTVFKFR